MTKNKEDIVHILKSEQSQLFSKWPIASLALFGSVARRDQTPDSDVDLLISGPIGWDFMALADEIEAILGEKADLIPRQGIQPRYWERIASEVIEIARA